AFNITSRFEGRAYHTIDENDSEIICYGRFQFTLASGSLERIISTYVTQVDSATARELRHYQTRIANRDEALRQDRQFKDLLVTAAREPAMQHVQDEEIVTHFWGPLKRIALHPRNLHTPLAWALLFDISMEFGLGDGFLRMA